MQIILSPFEHPGLSLDSAVEQQFRKLINRNFSFRYPDSEVEKEEKRWLDWFGWRWFRSLDKHESVWRITASGDVVYGRQIRVRLQTVRIPLGVSVTPLLICSC